MSAPSEIPEFFDGLCENVGVETEDTNLLKAKLNIFSAKDLYFRMNTEVKFEAYLEDIANKFTCYEEREWTEFQGRLSSFWTRWNTPRPAKCLTRRLRSLGSDVQGLRIRATNRT